MFARPPVPIAACITGSHASSMPLSQGRVYKNIAFYYRVTSYTWPCVSGSLLKVTCPVYPCSVTYIGQVTFYKIPEEKKRHCLSGQAVYSVYIFLVYEQQIKNER